MKIEKQCCTIEQSYRLQKLGIDGKLSIFSYCSYLPDPTGQHEGYTIIMDSEHRLAGVSEQLAPAFTVAELGLMLPGFPNWNWETYFHASENEWKLRSGHSNDEGSADSEAQCRAKILIHLLENNHITASDCNERLTA